MRLTINGPDASPEYRARLDALLGEVFGLSLAYWHAQGGWTQDYTCYSLEDLDRVVSNVSVYEMDLLVGGGPQRCRQIGAVATSPELRGQGLSRRLLETIFQQDPDGPYFLFANPSVLDFYPRFGFRQVPDRAPLLELSSPLGLGEMYPTPVDDPRVRAYLSRRSVFSPRLDCANSAPLALFHLLYTYPGAIFEIPHLGALVVAEQTGSRLDLVDVIATRPVTWQELEACLGFYGVQSVRFGFHPGWLGVDPTYEEEDTSPFFVRGALDMPPGSVIPWTART